MTNPPQDALDEIIKSINARDDRHINAETAKAKINKLIEERERKLAVRNAAILSSLDQEIMTLKADRISRAEVKEAIGPQEKKPKHLHKLPVQEQLDYKNLMWARNTFREDITQKLGL